MNDLMRPALIWFKSSNNSSQLKIKKVRKKTYEFVGPICESTDKFLTSKNFKILKKKI